MRFYSHNEDGAGTAEEETRSPKPKKAKKPQVTTDAGGKGKVVKKAVKKAAKADKAKPERPAGAGGVTGNQIRLLQALKSGKEMTRAQLADATGIIKGYSKMLGNVEGTHENSLTALGLVKCMVAEEGERGMRYAITAKGKQLLTKNG